jgi:hypothetical protein
MNLCMSLIFATLLVEVALPNAGTDLDIIEKAEPSIPTTESFIYGNHTLRYPKAHLDATPELPEKITKNGSCSTIPRHGLKTYAMLVDNTLQCIDKRISYLTNKTIDEHHIDTRSKIFQGELDKAYHILHTWREKLREEQGYITQCNPDDYTINEWIVTLCAQWSTPPGDLITLCSSPPQLNIGLIDGTEEWISGNFGLMVYDHDSVEDLIRSLLLEYEIKNTLPFKQQIVYHPRTIQYKNRDQNNNIENITNQRIRNFFGYTEDRCWYGPYFKVPTDDNNPISKAFYQCYIHPFDDPRMADLQDDHHGKKSVVWFKFPKESGYDPTMTGYGTTWIYQDEYDKNNQ